MRRKSAERFSQAGRAGVVLRFGGFYGHDAFQTTEMIKYIRKGWALLPGSPGAYISSLAGVPLAEDLESKVTFSVWLDTEVLECTARLGRGGVTWGTPLRS